MGWGVATPRYISSRFPRDSEADASESLGNLKEIIPSTASGYNIMNRWPYLCRRNKWATVKEA